MMPKSGCPLGHLDREWEGDREEWAPARCLKPLETNLLSRGREAGAPVKEAKGL